MHDELEQQKRIDKVVNGKEKIVDIQIDMDKYIMQLIQVHEENERKKRGKLEDKGD